MELVGRPDKNQLLDRLEVYLQGDVDRIVEVANWTVQAVDTPFTRADVLFRRRVVAAYKDRLQQLLRIELVPQRTPEWLALRHTLISASDAAQALGKGKFGSAKDFLRKKIGFEAPCLGPAPPPCVWGTMMEPVAQAIYVHMTGLRVHEFGLIPHASCPYFGASPDGINENGVMLELKCPWRRSIDGSVPLQYWYQMLGQLDVCGLQEVDYLEAKLEELPEHIFWKECATSTALVYRGVVVERANAAVNARYTYSGVKDDPETLKAWLALQQDQHTGGMRVHFWQAKRVHLKRLYHEPDTIAAILQELAPVWQQVLRYRSDRELYDRDFASPAEQQVVEIDTEPLCPAGPAGYAFLDDAADNAAWYA
jgi:putative phage-type endonuclease